MKIAYFDLNQGWGEDYSVFPKRYGGGRIFAAYAKQAFNNSKDQFDIYGNSICFENLTESENSNYHTISQENINKLRQGENIFRVLPDFKGADILVHHFSNIYIKSDPFIPQVCWSVGYREQINQNFKYAIFYNNYQFPIFHNPNTKILKAVIGKPIPLFQEYKKEDFVFQCTRHTPNFGSIEVASLCLQKKIPIVFAGPIDNYYPLLNYADGEIVKYVGVITEEEKAEYYKKARASTFIHTWPTPFNLSAIEALSYGCPIISTNIGFWKSLVDNGKNGFVVNSSQELFEAINKAGDIKQIDCYNSAKPYSVQNMLGQFYKAFEIVINSYE